MPSPSSPPGPPSPPSPPNPNVGGKHDRVPPAKETPQATPFAVKVRCQDCGTFVVLQTRKNGSVTAPHVCPPVNP